MKTPSVLLILMLPLAASAGDMYKWTDKSGTVHYTQTPPPAGAVTGKITKPPPPVAPRLGLQNLSKTYDEEHKKKAEAEAKAGAGKDDKAKLCAKAQANLAQMATHNAHRLATTDEQGKVSRMTSTQYDEIKAESENDVRLYCK
jgi:hypothetical protein